MHTDSDGSMYYVPTWLCPMKVAVTVSRYLSTSAPTDSGGTMGPCPLAEREKPS
jgi:hypothetical protein